MVVHITSPTSVGVGTTSTSVYDQGGNLEGTSRTTGLRTNYRGAICLNDSNAVSGDYDDMILRCYSATIANPGGASDPSQATITSVQYTNQGAFYGQPVSTHQKGNNGHIITGDGTEGDDSYADGGFLGDSAWRRLDNLTYMYNVPGITLSKYTHTSNSEVTSGQFRFTGTTPRLRIHRTDANGNDLYNLLFPYSNNQPQESAWLKCLIKVTSLDTNSTYNNFSGEKKWMICEIDNDMFYDGSVAGKEEFVIRYKAVYCNFNLTSSRGSLVAEPWGNAIVEILPPDYITNTWPRPLGFFISQEAEESNGGFLIQTMRVANNVYSQSLNQFVHGDCIYGPSGGFKFTRNLVSVYPNTPYYVWAYANGNDPKVKIINVPAGFIQD